LRISARLERLVLTDIYRVTTGWAAGRMEIFLSSAIEPIAKDSAIEPIAKGYWQEDARQKTSFPLGSTAMTLSNG
jgi:hypothetical protein